MCADSDSLTHTFVPVSVLRAVTVTYFGAHTGKETGVKTAAKMCRCGLSEMGVARRETATAP